MMTTGEADHNIRTAPLLQALLLEASLAREKQAADLADRDRVALVWATGGALHQRWDGDRLILTTGPTGFYNDAEGKVVVVHGPKRGQ